MKDYARSMESSDNGAMDKREEGMRMRRHEARIKFRSSSLDNGKKDML